MDTLTFITTIGTIGLFLFEMGKEIPKMIDTRRIRSAEKKLKKAYKSLEDVSENASNIFGRIEHLSNFSRDLGTPQLREFHDELEELLKMQIDNLLELTRCLSELRNDELVFLHSEVNLESQIRKLGDAKLYWLESFERMPEPGDPEYSNFFKDYLNRSGVRERIGELDELVKKLRQGISDLP